MIFYFRDWDKRQMTIFSRYLTPVSLNLFQDTRTHLFSVSVYLSRPQHWDGVDTSNPSSWNATTDSSHVVNTMAVDSLATDGARPSAAMMVTYSRGIFQSQHSAFFSMTTSTDGNIFRVTGPSCGNSPVTGEFPSQRPVTRSFDVFSDLCLNKRLSKQSWSRWFETPSHSLWRQCNGSSTSNV